MAQLNNETYTHTRTYVRKYTHTLTHTGSFAAPPQHAASGMLSPRMAMHPQYSHGGHAAALLSPRAGAAAAAAGNRLFYSMPTVFTLPCCSK